MSLPRVPRKLCSSLSMSPSAGGSWWPVPGPSCFRWRPLWPTQVPVYSWSRQQGPAQRPGPWPTLLRHPRKLREAAGYVLALGRHRVPVLTGWGVVRCEGDGCVERAVLARLGPSWERLAEPRRIIPADAVCVSYGFVPRLELASQLGASAFSRPDQLAIGVVTDATMGTSVGGLFVAGELAGVAGAEVAELEGELAGHSAAQYLGLADGRGPAERQRLLRRLRHGRAFAARLSALYPLAVGWSSGLEPSTVFCRCEQVPWEAVEASHRPGRHNSPRGAQPHSLRNGLLPGADLRASPSDRRRVPRRAGRSTRSAICTIARSPCRSHWAGSPAPS